MNYEELKTRLIEELKAEFPFCRFTLMQTSDRTQEFIICQIPEINQSPALDIKGLFEEFPHMEEDTLHRITEYFQYLINESVRQKGPVITDTFEEMKDKILCRLINLKRHPELRKKAIHIPYLDLHIVFFVPFQSKYECFLLHPNILDEWNITETQLLDAAKRNFSRLNPPECLNSKKYTLQMLKEEGINPCFFKGPLPDGYFITCPAWHYGASLLLFPEFFYSYAKELNSDLYLIPLSEHHLVIEKADVPLSKLKGIHSAMPIPDEAKLSDQIYLYRKGSREISIVVNPLLRL